MFKRLFSSKGDATPETADGQGSLLDLLDRDSEANGNVIEFPAEDSASGSLLSAINDIEVEAERSRQIAHAERLAGQQTVEQRAAHAWQPFADVVNSRPAVPESYQSESARPVTNQQEQLELLSKELESIAERARLRGDATRRTVLKQAIFEQTSVKRPGAK